MLIFYICANFTLILESDLTICPFEWNHSNVHRPHTQRSKSLNALGNSFHCQKMIGIEKRTRFLKRNRSRPLKKQLENSNQTNTHMTFWPLTSSFSFQRDFQVFFFLKKQQSLIIFIFSHSYFCQQSGRNKSIMLSQSLIKEIEILQTSLTFHEKK